MKILILDREYVASLIRSLAKIAWSASEMLAAVILVWVIWSRIVWNGPVWIQIVTWSYAGLATLAVLLFIIALIVRDQADN